LEIKIFGGNPNWFNRYKNQEIKTIGSSPAAPKHQLTAPWCAAAPQLRTTALECQAIV